MHNPMQIKEMTPSRQGAREMLLSDVPEAHS